MRLHQFHQCLGYGSGLEGFLCLQMLVLSPGHSKLFSREPEGEGDGWQLPSDVWCRETDGDGWGRVQGNSKERRETHQNQLPELYLERVIRACSNPGDLVLDPFLGSGTTSTVARALGRRSIGIEISQKYAESAFERIKAGAVRV